VINKATTKLAYSESSSEWRIAFIKAETSRLNF